MIPTRRTRASAQVSTAWQIDAHTGSSCRSAAAPTDSVVSPDTAVEIERLGSLAVLDGEGLWTRYEDPARAFDALREDGADLQRYLAAPVQPELLSSGSSPCARRGCAVAVRLSPQHTDRAGLARAGRRTASTTRSSSRAR